MPGDVLTTLADDQLGRLALIEAIRANTDAVSRFATRSDAQDLKLDEIVKALGAIDRRIAIIEHNSTPRDLERLGSEVTAMEVRMESRLAATELRITALEAERNQRKGALGLVEWLGRNWPALIGFVVLIVIMAKNGMLAK